MNGKELTELSNLKIKEVTNTESHLKIKLQDDTELKYYAYGDCCSCSYIEDLDNVEALQDCTLLSVSSESGESKEIDDFDVHKWTFYKFKTDKGDCTLSFRNESNGYYDGELVAEGHYNYESEK